MMRLENLMLIIFSDANSQILSLNYQLEMMYLGASPCLGSSKLNWGLYCRNRHSRCVCCICRPLKSFESTKQSFKPPQWPRVPACKHCHWWVSKHPGKLQRIPRTRWASICQLSSSSANSCSKRFADTKFRAKFRDARYRPPSWARIGCSQHITKTNGRFSSSIGLHVA